VTSVTGGSERRLGVFGGTFDPPHIGHLLAAVSARDFLGLDRILMVPNGDPWQKRDRRRITPAEVRLEMVVAATQGVPGVDVSDLEVRRDGPSYAVDTVAALRSTHADLDITLILGRDAAAGLASWHRHHDLLRSVELGIVERPGCRATPGDDVVGSTRVSVVGMPRVDVSSSDIRQRVAQGRPIDVMVPPAVVDLISSHGLYRVSLGPVATAPDR